MNNEGRTLDDLLKNDEVEVELNAPQVSSEKWCP